MIKLPIMLTERPTWQEALTDSVLTRQKLAEPARQEPDFLRPIVLIQAESKDREVTVKVVEDYLLEHEQKKKNIGERWAEQSSGEALFFWAVKKDEQGRDVHRQLQDKLAQS